MDNWDDKKLAEVVAKKAVGTTGNPTAGICKHFIKAIEDGKFGWFWECPQGEKCKYRHALPPGYKLAEKKQKEEKNVERPIEEILDEKRAALPTTGGTPVTADSFKIWKAKLIKIKEAEDKKNKQARAQAIQTGRMKKTGREILQESESSFKEEMEEGEDMDILAYLQQKKAEEEALDIENAELVQKLSVEAAESERAFDKRVAELESQGFSAAEALAKLTISDTPIITVPIQTSISPQEESNEDQLEEIEEENANQDEKESTDDGENVLEGVDKDLFEVEAEQEQDDLPEFSDED